MKKLCMMTTVVALGLSFANCSSKDSVSTLTTEDQKVSYMIGLDMGAYLKNMGISVRPCRAFARHYRYFDREKAPHDPRGSYQA